MSEVKLNLSDAQQILHGTIHGSVADACVAALSADPETIDELKASLARYIKSTPPALETKGSPAPNQVGLFASFRSATHIDTESWDAGLVIIDLAARLVFVQSSYSQPQQQGEVRYHNGVQSTDIPILYRVSDEWKFLGSLAEFKACQTSRRKERATTRPLNARRILYGRELLEFVVWSVRQSSVCRNAMRKASVDPRVDNPHTSENEISAERKNSGEHASEAEEEAERAIAGEISAIHARWLLTERDDLDERSPREVLLAKLEFIDFDLHTRALQWSLQGEEPPCLAKDSFAYRTGGFGTHEYVVYYDLVRHLLWSALGCRSLLQASESTDLAAAVTLLEQIKNEWLETPQEDFDGRVPANIIENERRRLPITLGAREMIIDEDCEICVASANEIAMGGGPGFWYLDGSHMDDEFAFSFCRTRSEWDEENRRREEFNLEFNRRWEERKRRLAQGESVDEEFDLDWVDSFQSKSLLAQSSDEEDESTSSVQQ